MEPGRDASIGGLLIADHRRLEDLLDRATARSGTIDGELYARFRAGLLRHIAAEEKVLLPSLRDAQGGRPLPVGAVLRRQHGAIAALLVPSPTPRVVAVLRAVLAVHNLIEEGPEGVYARCDRVMATAREEMCRRLRAVPDARPSPHHDGSRALPAAARALARAGLGELGQHLLAPQGEGESPATRA